MTNLDSRKLKIVLNVLAWAIIVLCIASAVVVCIVSIGG
jgi:hypothetical protein